MFLSEHASDNDPIYAECMRVLDVWMDAVNRGDTTAMDACMHFPHARLGEARMFFYPDAGSNPADVLQAVAASDGWKKSVWLERTLLQSSNNKAHFNVSYTRLRADGSEIGRYDALYVMTKIGGVWGVQMRSSFAP